MTTLFPMMTARPDTEKIVGTFACWVLSFVLIPVLLPFLLQDFGLNGTVPLYIQIGYHLVNGAVMVAVHRDYLYYALLDFRLKWKECLIVIAICVVLILVVVYPLALCLGSVSALLALPVVEVELMMFSPQILGMLPLPGLLCVVVAAPISICCMIYAVCFAPGCCSDHPWTGYLTLVLLVALPRLLCTSLAIDASILWPLYFSQLPIHLICCWAFQKTDTLIVPAGILMTVNLISSLVMLP